MKLDAYFAERRGRLTELADELGIPVSTLHGWASGRRRPNIDAAMAVQRATRGKVTAADLALAQREAA